MRQKKRLFAIIIIICLLATSCVGVSSIFLGDLIPQEMPEEQGKEQDQSDEETENQGGTAQKVEAAEIEPEEEKIPIIFDDPEKQKSAERAAQREPALKEFFMGYPDNDGRVTGGYTKEEIEAEHPHFLQYDKRWGYYAYGTSCMGFAGCAPTAMAMVCLELVGDTSVTPNVIADYAMENGYYIKNQGTAWKFFTNGEAFGVKGRILPFSEENMKRELDEGHPIIISLGPGDFTKNGHIAVIASYDEEGFVVSDPGSNIRTQKRWDMQTLIPQVKQLWVYEKIEP